jgi:tetratricopeptide (TPR) repeat protein
MAEIDGGCTIIGLEGVGGVGKSEFSRQFARVIQEDRGPEPILIDAGFAQTEDLLIASLYAQLAAVPRVAEQAFEEKARKFLGGLGPKLRTVAGAMIFDLAKAATLGQGERTIEALADIIAGTDASGDGYSQLEALEQSNRRMLIYRYLHFVADLGNPLLIVVDDYELTQSSAREFLQVLMRAKPDNCLLMIAVNTESQPQSDWRHVVAPNILAAGGVVLPLEGLTRDDLADWHEASLGSRPDNPTLDELISQSRGGRAAYVEQILAALAVGGPVPRIPDVADLHRARRRGLSLNARLIGELMALIPSDVSIPISILAAAAQSGGVVDTTAAIDELEGASVIRRCGDRVRFVHASVGNTWALDIDPLRHDTLRNLWSDAAEKFGYVGPSVTISGLLPLVAGRIVEQQSGPTISQLADELVQRGAQDDSLVLLNSSWRGISGSEASQNDMIEHALAAARLQLDLGQYARAQEPLHAVEIATPDGSPLRIAADLLRMKLALRQNCYAVVWTLSDKLEKMAQGDPQVQLERELIVNTALRDFAEPSQIADSIVRLSAYLDQGDDSARSEVNRSLARSFAKVGKTADAIRLAEEGLKLARSQGEARAIGNAHLAVGEALRHAHREGEAIEYYRQAIDHGKGTGNRDSEIWSWLGEACVYLQTGDFAAARRSAEQAAKLTHEAGYEHPLEAAHVALIDALANLLSNASIDMELVLEPYERLGIEWPRRYLDDVRSQGQLPCAIPI